jgi:hypothetical protein
MFHVEKTEFLFVSVDPLGKAIVPPVVSEIDAIDPLPPFALNETAGFELSGVVYRRMTTPAAPALDVPALDVICDPPPPLFAAGASELTPPPDDALPVVVFDPAPPEPYISVVPVISELTPTPPVVPLPAPPAPPPPPDA